jgi:hypothetical protein
VFRAEAKGKPLHFDTAGLIGANEIFRDRETGTRWQQSSLKAISGSLKGTQLELFPFLLTTWQEWHRLHRATLVLKPLPGYVDNLAAENQRISAGLEGGGPAPRGALSRDNRLPPRTTILGLEMKNTSVVFPLATLRKVKIINDEIAGEPVLIVHQPDSDTTTAFVARHGARTLHFKAADAEAHRLVDLATHSHWNAYGYCLAGALKGAQLKSLILEPEFWFAWSEFHPSTVIYAPTSHQSRAPGS